MLKFGRYLGSRQSSTLMLEVGGADTFEGVYSDKGKVTRGDSYNVTYIEQ